MMWIRILDLVARLALLDPSLTTSTATANGMAAAIAETPAVPAELLLAVARTESSFDPRWVSRLEDGIRTIGVANRRVGTGPRFCGPLQTAAGSSWSACLFQRDIFLGYLIGGVELGYWIRRAGGDWRAALCGYAGGNRAFTARSCGTYATRVLRRAWSIGMAKPENVKRNARVKERRIALLKLISPGTVGRCDRCGMHLLHYKLEIDHVDGRPDYESSDLSSCARVSQYEREYAAGVKLRTLCRYCNALGSGRRYGRKRIAAARDRSRGAS